MCMEATSGRNKMTNTVSVCVFYALLCATIVKASIMVEIEPKRETAVRVGETLQILCRANRPLRVCRVEIPGESNAIVLLPDDKPEDGIRFYGNGFNEGECGVSIAKVKDTHDGVFKCFLTPTDSRQETSASLRIIVARPPNAPIINVSRATSYGEDAFKNGERLDVSCSAPAGRPAANVTLFLDDELITQDSSVNYNSPAMQNLSRVLDWKDNGKTLRCLAHHIALDRPLESTYLLNVHYAPQPEETFQRFGYVIGRQGVINVTVYANPKPKFTWRVNNEKIDEGRPDNSGRLETSSAVDLGRGAWSLIMTIDSVQKSDTEKEYTLEAANIMGTNEYRVVLSTSSEPAGPFSSIYGKLSEHMHALGVDLDAGSIIGIVVGVLALVLVIFLVIFARATGRWCFAGRSSTRNLGESSDTESAGRYSRSEVDGSSSREQRKPRLNLSRLFGRNKDKVSGADTDTMKTVVTVDDEKLQAAEPTASAQEGRTSSPRGEGGIVYAELDLQQQQGAPPRRLNDEKTEYAEILYTKPEAEETADK